MKLPIVIFLLLSVASNAQVLTRIDSLETEKEVEAFINLHENFYKEKIKLEKINFKKPIEHLYERLPKIKTFQKADFDNNNYTDLLIIWNYRIIVLMNYGNDEYEWNYIQSDRNSYFRSIAIINYINEKPIIELYDVDIKIIGDFENITEREYSLIETNLIYKYGNFIELNLTPKEIKFEKIEFEAGRCFGSCPWFKLQINDTQKSELYAISENRDENGYETSHGKYQTTIDSTNFASIIQLLNYIDFENLKEQYTAFQTCGPTYNLIITYNNGQTKTITDYSSSGTHGLELLYQKLFDLRFNQDWIKTE